ALLALERYQSVVEPKAFARLGLRYINRVALPDEQPNLAEYFTLAPQLPAGIAGTLSSFVQQLENQVEETDVLRILFGSVLPQEGEVSAFVLDLDFFTRDGAIQELGAAGDWLE